MKKYIFARLLAGVLLFGASGGLPSLSAGGNSEGSREAENIQTKTLRHSLGTVEVSGSIQRVIAIDWDFAEMVLALGMQPVGITQIEGYKKWVNIPAALDESVVDVGKRGEPNLERIIELRHDLIITATDLAANNYDELNAIAPTLLFNNFPEDNSSQYEVMLNIFRTIAAALNREEAAEAVLAELERTFYEANTALKRRGLEGGRFVLAQSYLVGDASDFRLFTDNAMVVEIMKNMGLKNFWNGTPGKFGFSTVGFEGLGAVAADTRFFWIAHPDARKATRDAPVWDSLPFVRSESVHWLGGDVFLFGGPLSAAALVEKILASLGTDS